MQRRTVSNIVQTVLWLLLALVWVTLLIANLTENEPVQLDDHETQTPEKSP